MSASPDAETDMAKRQFHNPPPRGVPEGAPRDAAFAEFGRRIQHILVQKGWNQSELARQATKFMPGKTPFRRDNISLYVRGLQFPGPVRLGALCKALGVTSEELVPGGAILSVDDKTPPLSMRVMSDGSVFLQVNQAVPMKTAMQVITLLGQNDAVDKT